MSAGGQTAHLTRPTRARSPVLEPERASAGATVGFGLLGLVALAYVVSLILRTNGQTWTSIDGWGVSAFEMVAGLVIVAKGLAGGPERPFCLIMGVGACFWASGDFAMTIETLGGATPPDVSAANYFWAGFYPLAYVAVMLLMRREVRRFSLATYLDGVMTTLAAAALFAAFAFSAIEQAAGGSTASVAVNTVYPVGDLLLLVMLGLGIGLLPAGNRRRWYLLAAACTVNLSGDVSALFPGLVASRFGFVSNSGAWPVSLFLIALAVWLPSRAPDSEPAELTPGFRLPALAAGAVLTVLVVSSLHRTSSGALALVTATLIAVGVRFGLTLMQMRALTDDRHRQLEEAAQTERGSRGALQAAVAAYSQFAAKVADGDLTVKVDAEGSDELHALSEGLNGMVSGLAEISGEVHAGVSEIRVSTAEILQAVSHHTESAGQQSNAIRETSTTVDELRVAADQTAQQAREVAERAQGSAQVSEEGIKAIDRIAGAMDEIRERVEGIAHDIVTLSERTQQIGEITQTVNAIADRSNLLALNASIEAARAGEHGKGFAVVADEVRHLAERSKAATAQVESVLADIQEAMSAAVRASEEGTKVVERGRRLTGLAGEGIHSLTLTIAESSQWAEQISASAHEQSLGMDQIAQAMRSVNDQTTQFLTGAQQSQSAAEDLNELSSKLAALTERYRV
jgi:methyl-accepting chemotaxis protein